MERHANETADRQKLHGGITELIAGYILGVYKSQVVRVGRGEMARSCLQTRNLGQRWRRG